MGRDEENVQGYAGQLDEARIQSNDRYRIEFADGPECATEEPGIIDGGTGLHLLAVSPMPEQSHIADQLEGIALSILNGRADIGPGAGVNHRYVVTLIPSAEGPWINAYVMDTRPPPPAMPPGMTVDWLFYGRAGTSDDLRTDVIAAASKIADGLNYAAYDWRQCTAEQREQRESLPIPAWA